MIHNDMGLATTAFHFFENVDHGAASSPAGIERFEEIVEDVRVGSNGFLDPVSVVVAFSSSGRARNPSGFGSCLEFLVHGVL